MDDSDKKIPQYYTLITGASSGIGKSLSYRYAKANCSLILVARRENLLLQLQQNIQKDYPVKVHIVVCNLLEQKAPLTLFKTIQEKGWTVNTLINNAGIGDHSLFSTSNWNKITQILQLNIKSTLHLTHLFLPVLRETSNSSILFISSITSFIPGPFMASYYASKAFITSFANAIFSENKGIVHILNICPGPLDTGFSKVANFKIKRFKPLMISVPRASNLIYQAHMQQKRQIILGKRTQFVAFLSWLLPTIITLKIVRLLNR